MLRGAAAGSPGVPPAWLSNLDSTLGVLAMTHFLIRRFAIMIPMIFLMSFGVFAIIQAPPADFVVNYIASIEATGDRMDSGEAEAMKRQFGLDEPLHEQYYQWISQMVLHGDLGRSIEYRRPVKDLIGQRLLMTVSLVLFTIIFTWSLAVPIGILSALKQYSFLDYFFTFISYLGVGTPNFLLALVIMWLVWAWWGLSVTGLFSPEYHDAAWSISRVIDVLKHIWVPMLILGTDGTARFVRIIRANLLDELNKPYVEVARAKGLPEWKLLLKYPTRIALNPFVSTVGWQIPQLISGSLIVATVMSLPTLGPLLLGALLFGDSAMASSIILILSLLTMIGTLISDIMLAMMDSRIRMSG